MSDDMNPLDEFLRWSDEAAQRHFRRMAEIEEARARRAFEEKLPRPLHWTIDRPRVLKMMLRVVPRWRPEVRVVMWSTAEISDE